MAPKLTDDFVNKLNVVVAGGVGAGLLLAPQHGTKLLYKDPAGVPDIMSRHTGLAICAGTYHCYNEGATPSKNKLKASAAIWAVSAGLSALAVHRGSQTKEVGYGMAATAGALAGLNLYQGLKK
mmetsp:Transcript_40332/g.89565  ORF Transcript_40332/g.89565 Transcript_40332/m.89565 type:complete len:124 (-) Transcript_40332:569-940(-)